MKILTVSYSVNGKPIDSKDLKKLKITKKDYIDYIESIRKNVKNFHSKQIE